MTLRHSDGGWHNTPEVVLSIQLTNQASFSARDEALTAMKAEFQEEKDE